MSRWPAVFIALGLMAVGTAASADDDPVRVKLDKAKAAYEADMGKYKASVMTWFEKREETARKTGDKKTVDQVKAERSTFEANGELPSSTPAAIKAQLSAARSTLDAAFKAAIAERTKAKRDDEAAAIEKEWAIFQSGKSGSATKLEDRIVGRVWSTSKSQFEFKPGGVVLLNGKPVRQWAVIGPDRVVTVDEAQNYDIWVFDKEFANFQAYFIGQPGKTAGFTAKSSPIK